MQRWMTLAVVVFSTASLFGAASLPLGDSGAAKSQWVYFDANGKLSYRQTPAGDRIMDFSSAGYMGGGVKIPSVPVKATVSPSGGDDTAAIQQAIDAVANAPMVNGMRGAVLLQPGAFTCDATIRIKASGVVLRGSGADSTTLRVAGKPHLCISVTGGLEVTQTGRSVTISDAYVPSGADKLHVENASQFRPGDLVQIVHPVTRAWVSFMGMDKLVRDGRKETWLSGDIATVRTIAGVSGNEITFDLPLTDSLDARYLNPPGASLVKCEASGGISQVGIESLKILGRPQSVTISEAHDAAIRLSGVTDAWVRDVTVADTVNSVGIGGGSRRITVENMNISHSVATKGAAKPADFSADGSQVLIDRCSDTGDNLFYFVTGARVSGPIVLLNCVFHGNGHVEPHQRWATGLLIDNCRVPESGIDLMNRGEMGSGHGWTIGWSVVWNCQAKSFVIQQPPGAYNWAIGCEGAFETAPMPFGNGPKMPPGLYDSPGKPVSPRSLYLAQLRERLGPDAIKNVGY